MNEKVKNAVNVLMALSKEDLMHAKHLFSTCDTVRKGVRSKDRHTLNELTRNTPAVAGGSIATVPEVREILQQDLPGCRYSFSVSNRKGGAYYISGPE